MGYNFFLFGLWGSVQRSNPNTHPLSHPPAMRRAMSFIDHTNKGNRTSSRFFRPTSISTMASFSSMMVAPEVVKDQSSVKAYRSDGALSISLSTTSPTVLPTGPRPMVEWVLWRHYCRNAWAQSEQDWNDGIEQVCHFVSQRPTLEDEDEDEKSNDTRDVPFLLPLPSESFFLKSTQNSGKHWVLLQHKEYSLFRKDVRPEWEDPQCQCELYAKHYLPPNLLDAYWFRLVKTGILEGFIDDRYVVGIRVVDKSKGRHPMYKFEIWLNTKNPSILPIVRRQVMDCLQQEEQYQFNLHFRDFFK